MTFPSKPVIEKLARHHDVSQFDCGSHALNTFLQRYAWQNQKKGSVQNYLALVGEEVAGFYSLTYGQLEYADAPSLLAKGMPRHPIPIILLARLGIDLQYQGMKLGAGLLVDALHRTLQAAEIAGIRAIVVHAKDEKARAFYSHLGFQSMPQRPLVLFRLLQDIKHMLGE